MKIRMGFVSNSSSSSFMCLGIERKTLIQELLAVEKLKKDEDGNYTNSGSGVLEGKVINFYKRGDYFKAAGFDDTKTKKILEKMTLREARKEFTSIIEKKLKIKINESEVDLFSGEASSE